MTLPSHPPAGAPGAPAQGQERDERSPPHDDLGFALPEPATLTRARALVIGAVAIAVLGGAFAIGFLPRHRARAALEAETRVASVETLRVQVVTPKAVSSDRSLTLPASIQALEETVIYPRTSGYVRKWYFDIGDAVKEGDLLAEIDAPEVDQQLLEGRATLARAEATALQAKATSDFSKQNLERYEQLAPAGIASTQELEQKRAQAAVDQANVRVAQANVEAQRAVIQRLTQLQSFSRVVAPFTGKVTARSVERGALVTAGNSTPLFKVAAMDPVRVFLQLPQDVAPSVRVELPAKITVREYGGRMFEGKVAHAAGVLDPASRTMTTEVRVPNPDGALLSGMYAQVALMLPTPHRVYELPGTALLNDAKGLQVAAVGQDQKIHLMPVVMERDTGASIEIASGLEGNEQVVKLAGAELTEGRLVEVIR